MKVAIVLLAVAVVGALAEESSGIPPFVCTDNAFVCAFKKIGHQIKYHAKKLGGQLGEVGSAVLKSALEQGTTLLKNGAQAVAGTVLDHLNKEGLVGKRFVGDRLKDMWKQGAERLAKWRKGMAGSFAKAIGKLTGVVAANSQLQGGHQTGKKVDDAVKEFNKESNKGFVELAKTVVENLGEIVKAGLELAKEKKGGNEKRAIVDVWNSFKGHLSSLTGALKDTFKPHLDVLQKGVADLAEKAKGHASNLAQAAKDSFNDLKTKLSGHIDTLKGHAGKLGEHGKNALNALKEAVVSIAKTALENTKDTIGDAVKTGVDAAGVVSGHVADAIKQ